MVLKPGYDWFELLLPRPRPDPPARRDPLRDVPPVGRRQGRPGLGRPPDARRTGATSSCNIISKSSCTGHAVPPRRRRRGGGLADGPDRASSRTRARFQRDEVVYVSGGEGQTSEGEFWEALSSASNLKLPVLFLIEDNGYAISVPVEVNTPGGSISKLVAVLPEPLRRRGRRHATSSSPTTRCATPRSTAASAWARRSSTPASSGPYSHSLSDDEALYRPKAEREREAGEGPAAAALAPAPRAGHPRARGAREAARRGRRRDQRGRRPRARRGELPEPESAYDFVYSPDVDPTSAAFSTRAASPPRAPRRPRWSTS